MNVNDDHLDQLRSEGDLNISPQREEWVEWNIDASTQAILDEDAAADGDEG